MNPPKRRSGDETPLSIENYDFKRDIAVPQGLGCGLPGRFGNRGRDVKTFRLREIQESPWRYWRFSPAR